MGLGTFISDKKQVAAGWESKSSRVQTEEGRGTLGCFQNTSRSSRETERAAVSSLEDLTSLKDSAESSVVVVVVETFRPDP